MPGSLLPSARPCRDRAACLRALLVDCKMHCTCCERCDWPCHWLHRFCCARCDSCRSLSPAVTPVTGVHSLTGLIDASD